jgi:hypothetical protein
LLLRYTNSVNTGAGSGSKFNPYSGFSTSHYAQGGKAAPSSDASQHQENSSESLDDRLTQGSSSLKKGGTHLDQQTTKPRESGGVPAPDLP